MSGKNVKKGLENMKIMLDTNIFLDVILEREKFAESSAKVLTLCENRTLKGIISSSCVTDIFYIVRKYLHNTETAYIALGKIFEIADVCTVTGNDVFEAYKRKAADFEDCLQAVCAEKERCDYIITRNKKDFVSFGIPLAEPSELLDILA